MSTNKVLIFQEYHSLNVLIEAVLSTDGYENIYTVDNSNSVIRTYHDIQPDVFLCEIDVEHQLDMFIKLILSTDRLVVVSRVICIISNENTQMKKAAQRLGVENFLGKPYYAIQDIKDLVNKWRI